MDAGEHSSELGRWQTWQRAADPCLRAYVHGYVASLSNLRAPVLEHHVPSTEVPLFLNFGEPHRRLDAASGQWIARDSAWIVGLHNRHQLTSAFGERQFMVVRFTPLGAHLFLRLPMELIANEAIDLELIDPALARALVSRVAAAASWTDRFAAVESMIARRLADAEIPTAMRFAWRSILAADRRIALGSLAAQLDCSHRNLIARFRTCVGFPPKTIARLVRFNHTVRSLDRMSGTRADDAVGKPYIAARQPDDPVVGAIPWADLAVDCGYFDQAHLIKDFQKLAGMTPGAFVRRMSFVN